MNQFKEWLSDNLRYLVLLAALALGAAAIVLGVGMYKAYRAQSDNTAGEANLQTEVTVSANAKADQAIVENETGAAEEPEARVTEPTTSQNKTETETQEVQSETAKAETETQEAQSETAKTETETREAQSETAEKETQESLPKTLPIKIETKATESESEEQTESETKKEFEIANLQIETNAPRKTAESETKKAGSSSDDVLVGVSEQKLASQTETISQTPQTQASETQPPTETQAPETQPQTEEIDTLFSYNSATTLYASTSLNVRSGPGTEYGVLGDTDQGNDLTVTGETSNWYQVSFNGQTGYVSKNLLVTEYIPVYRTMTGTCYMRSEPDYGDNIIGEYGAGTTVEFLGDVGGWYKVRIDGKTGYMGTRFFE
ncbi:MAG: SH3 domain-containing protein [Lachnospiraceae bacterium]|nr:SH3 domain-containing protein [Lachnospiraceae bacterium]